MELNLQEKEFVFAGNIIKLFTPRQESIKADYDAAKSRNEKTPFPYWAKVWPAALGLSEFIQQYPHFVAGKEVLELAAGLGLPSLVAASFAQSVCCSDYLMEALRVIDNSIAANGLGNVYTRLLDWNDLSGTLAPDVLLLSDINYNPGEFIILKEVIHNFLLKGTTILLSTPQRLMAKSFIEPLLPFCRQSAEIQVVNNSVGTIISVYVLKYTIKP